MRPPWIHRNVRTVLQVLADLGRFSWVALQSRADLAAETLFLRKQLALYIERQVTPRRADDATRFDGSVRGKMLRDRRSCRWRCPRGRRGCVPGRRDRPSQRRGFGEDPLLKIRTEALLGQDFDPTAEELLKLLLQTDHVQQRST